MPKTDNRAGRRAEAAEKRKRPGSLRMKEEERRGQEAAAGKEETAVRDYLLTEGFLHDVVAIKGSDFRLDSTSHIRDPSSTSGVRRENTSYVEASAGILSQMRVLQNELRCGRVRVVVDASGKLSIQNAGSPFSGQILNNMAMLVGRVIAARKIRSRM